jgi:hypothetical protein
MATLKPIHDDNVIKLSTKRVIKSRKIRNILIIIWILQTLITIGYIFRG